MDNSKKLFTFKKPYVVLNNFVDQGIFYKKKKNIYNNKIKIISTCWAYNKNKGLETYRYLDEKLNFSKFEFTFIGNKNFIFKNIKHLGPMDQRKIATYLREASIFISPSLYESCSNSLLEAISVGLTVFYKSNTSSEEIAPKGFNYNDNSHLLEILNNHKFSLNTDVINPIAPDIYLNKLNFFVKGLSPSNKLNIFYFSYLFLCVNFFNFYKYFSFHFSKLFLK